MSEEKKNISLVYVGFTIFIVLAVAFVITRNMLISNLQLSFSIEISIILNWIVYYVVAMPIFLFITKNFNTHSYSNEYGEEISGHDKFTWMSLIYAAVISVNAVAVAIQILTEKLNSTTGEQTSVNVNDALKLIENINIFAGIVLIGIFGPLLEEFFFRRIMYSRLSAYGDKVYIFVSAACFSMLHLNIVQMIYSFFAGLILAYVYAKTGSFKTICIMHMSLNMYSVLIAGFLKTNFAVVSYIVAGIVMVMVIYGVCSVVRLKRGLVLEEAEYPLEESSLNASFLNYGFIIAVLGVVGFNLLRYFRYI